MDPSDGQALQVSKEGGASGEIFWKVAELLPAAVAAHRLACDNAASAYLEHDVAVAVSILFRLDVQSDQACRDHRIFQMMNLLVTPFEMYLKCV